jgi:ATP-binding cassette, subfamily G (WHITE), member 2, SNQ2
MLLNKGYMVYSGPASSCGAYFESLGFTPVEDKNPAEYVVSILLDLPVTGAKGQGGQNIESLALECRKFANAQDSLGPDAFQALMTTSTAKSVSSSFSSFSSALAEELYTVITCGPKLKVLMQREFHKERRRWRFWLAFFSRGILLGFFLGAVWHRLGSEGTDILQRLGLFLTTFLLASMTVTETIPNLHEEKVMFYRERETNATTTFATWVVLGFPYVIIFFFSSFCFVLPLYILSNLRGGLYHFFVYWMVTYMAIVANLCLSQIVGFMTETVMTNILIFPGITLAAQSLLCSYSVLITTLPLWFRWIVYVNPFFYAMDAFFVNEMKNYEFASSFNTYSYYIDGFGYVYSEKRALWILLGIAAVHKVLAYFVMRFVNHTKA